MCIIRTASFSLQVLFSFYFKNIPDLQKVFDAMGFGVTVSFFWYVPHYSATKAKYYKLLEKQLIHSLHFMVLIRVQFMPLQQEIQIPASCLGEHFNHQVFWAVLGTQAMLALRLFCIMQKNRNSCEIRQHGFINSMSWMLLLWPMPWFFSPLQSLEIWATWSNSRCPFPWHVFGTDRL